MDTFDNSFSGLSITAKDEDYIKSYLKILQIKDEKTYEHSKRVALLAARIATHLKLNPKPIFIAGCLHDIGKALISRELLCKKEKYTSNDMLRMKYHVIYSYNLINEVFPFAAEIVLRHHRWQSNPYPQCLKSPKIPFSLETQKLIDFYSRILSLADFIDALYTRENDLYKEEKESKKEILLKNNKDQEQLIESLYKERIISDENSESAK